MDYRIITKLARLYGPLGNVIIIDPQRRFIIVQDGEYRISFIY